MEISNISSEAIGPIITKFYAEPSEGSKLVKTGLGHITNNLAIPADSKTFRIFFSETNSRLDLKLDIWHRVLKLFQCCSNSDLGLTSTYFMAK